MQENKNLWQRFSHIAVSILGKIWQGFGGEANYTTIYEVTADQVRNEIFQNVCSGLAKTLGGSPVEAAQFLAQVFHGGSGEQEGKILDQFPEARQEWFQETCRAIFMQNFQHQNART